MVASRRVLVVDDEPLVAKSCRRILADKGYEVETTLSGKEGMDRAFAKDFDVVMTDLRMPDLDGMDLVRALRSQRPRTAIIVITGFGTVGSAIEATKLGVSDYVEKPFSPEQIADAVVKALGAAEAKPREKIEADLVEEVLALASKDNDFGRRLLEDGSKVLSGYALSQAAKGAIASGDLAWVEKTCGELTDEERDWLDRRLDREAW